jgi:hypothetical protein
MSEEKGSYLAVRNKEVTPAIWTMIREMAPVMHQARLFGVTSMEQAAAIMLKGHELGIGITASFELVQVVQGRPALSPRGALALLHSAPEIKTIKITRLVDGTGKFSGYECFMERVNGFAYSAKWTMEDAKRAGLVKPDSGWANYPENMCMWRAIGFVADVVAPDVTAGLTAGMKMPEKLGVAIDDNGDYIDGVIAPAKPEPVAPGFSAPAPLMTLNQLVDLFGPDAVLSANDGKYPQTDAELNGLVLKMSGGVDQ